jgi:hypothetical protein
MQGNLTARMRHYFGLQGAEAKFRRLLEDFEFQPLRVLVEELSNNFSKALDTNLSQLRTGEFCSNAIEL